MLAEDDYRESESGDLEITIEKNQDVTLANPVTVRITPLTVPEALARGIITSFDDDDILSPNRAGIINYNAENLSSFTCSIIPCEAFHIIIIGYPNVHLFPFSADTNDFNNTIFNITFDADENAPVAISGISALIPIVDDDKDEADIQFFIAFLEVVDAVNMDLIDIGRTFSRGIIVDNDGKY